MKHAPHKRDCIFSILLYAIFPIFFLLSCHDHAAQSDPTMSAVDFIGGEHQLLGDAAFDAAISGHSEVCSLICERDEVITSTKRVLFHHAIGRAHDRMKLSYGTIVALSGDFYGSPESLWREDRPNWVVNVPDIPFFPDIPDLKKYFLRERRVIDLTISGIPASREDYDVWFEKNAPGYLKLALSNGSHFGWNNMLTYVRYHKLAMNFASQAAKADSIDLRKMLLRKAFYWNGYADHFLTDGFTSGHIRVPRYQIDEWSTQRSNSKVFSSVLVKILHDHDGGSPVFNRPLIVRNARGDIFSAPVEENLAQFAAHGDLGFKLALEATRLSIDEVLDAYLGYVNSGIYSGTTLVPFPDHDAQDCTTPLTGVFSTSLSDDAIENLYSHADWYNKVSFEWGGWSIGSHLKPKHLKELFRDLPDIMKSFRSDVQRDVIREAMIVKHLPHAYKVAMSRAN